MTRLALDLQYDGSLYHGWQKQENARTVQSVLEESLSLLFGRPTELVGCGRTDTGVHAAQYIAHFESEAMVDKFIHRLNKMLPSDIGIIGLYEVPENFHARFDAISRTYLYKISKQKPVFETNFVYWDRRSYDIDKMNQASELLLRHDDFAAFCKKKEEGKTTTCKVDRAAWTDMGNLLVFEIAADRFLRNMVRSIVGTLLQVGAGNISVDDFEKIIASKFRGNAGPSAPAKGLTLKSVEYNRADWKQIG